MKIPSRLYIAPKAEEIALSLSSVIFSGSPNPGENEQISIEDWGDLINNE